MSPAAKLSSWQELNPATRCAVMTSIALLALALGSIFLLLLPAKRESRRLATAVAAAADDLDAQRARLLDVRGDLVDDRDVDAEALRPHQRLGDLVGGVVDRVVKIAESDVLGVTGSAPVEHANLVGCFKQEVEKIGRVHFARGILTIRR